MKKLLTLAMITSLSITTTYSITEEDAAANIAEAQKQVLQQRLAEKVNNLTTAIQQGDVNLAQILQSIDLNTLLAFADKYGNFLTNNLGNVLDQIAGQSVDIAAIKNQLANVKNYVAQLAQYKDTINPATHATEIGNALKLLKNTPSWNTLQAKLPAIKQQAEQAHNALSNLTAQDFDLLVNFANAAKKYAAGQTLTTAESDALFMGIDTVSQILPALAKVAHVAAALGSEVYTQVNSAQLANQIPTNVKNQLNQALPVLKDNLKAVADKLHEVLGQ